MATTAPGEIHEGKDGLRQIITLLNWIRRQFPIIFGGGPAGQANWPIGAVRWYGASTIRGNDAAAGYSDDSSADLGTKPKLTLAALAAILPRIGADRKICIELEGDFTGQGGLDVLLSSMSGYAANYPVVVATATNATASAVAFAGDAADRTNLGATTADGMNAAGYSPTGTLSASLIQCVKVGGGSPGFAAEPAIPLFCSMRFGSDSATQAALRNQCREVMQVTGTDTLTPVSAFTIPPLTTDTFYLEQPGTLVDASTISLPPEQTQTACQIVGFRSKSGTLQFVGGSGIFCFCDVTGFSARIGDTVLRPTYVDENGVTRTRGSGMRVDGALIRIDRCNGNFVQEAYGATGETTIEGCTLFGWTNGVSTWGGLSLVSTVGAVGNDNDQPISIIGGRFHASEPAARIRGLVSLHGVSAGLYAAQSSFTISSLDISSMGANPAIRLRGKCCFFADENLTGTTGNTDVGLDLTASQASTILLRSSASPTLTGTAGDIRLYDGSIVTWASFTALSGTYLTAGGNTFVVS
jgi:hypothetical protein